jgi:hypothetical protein
MKLDNYKNIKKSEWQEIAKQFGIEFDESSVVRYLVEKIAEKIGVDDKIVSDNELKKQVVEKINSDYEVIPTEEIVKEEIETEEIPVVKTKKSNSKKETTKKATNKKVTKLKSPVVGKVKTEKNSEEKVTEEPILEEPKLSRIDELRLECQNYGVAWSVVHSEQNLEEMLNAVKRAGVQKTGNATSLDAPVTAPAIINTNQAFEINSANAGQVAQSISNMPNPAFNPMAVPPPPPVNGGYKSSNTYLETYKNIYLNAIRGHFRCLSVNEIHEMINRDNQTFQHVVNLHPQQQNKAEIILTQGNDSIRIPSEDKNEWLEING